MKLKSKSIFECNVTLTPVSTDKEGKLTGGFTGIGGSLGQSSNQGCSNIICSYNDIKNIKCLNAPCDNTRCLNVDCTNTLPPEVQPEPAPTPTPTPTPEAGNVQMALFGSFF